MFVSKRKECCVAAVRPFGPRLCEKARELVGRIERRELSLKRTEVSRNRLSKRPRPAIGAWWHQLDMQTLGFRLPRPPAAPARR